MKHENLTAERTPGSLNPAGSAWQPAAIARNGCFDLATAEIIASHQDAERHDIPPRSDPDKYIYILTDEEKETNHPRLPTDECWALCSFWRVPNGSWEQSTDFGSCYYRRKRPNDQAHAPANNPK